MFAPRKLIPWLATITLIGAFGSFNARQVQAQGGIVVEDAHAVVKFGKSITFMARIKTTSPIKQASILFRGVNEEDTRVETVQIAEDGSVDFTYATSRNVFPPFSWIVFWFQATFTDNQTYTSLPITFLYNDNRFQWQEASRTNVTIHWYAGDEAFGAAALEAAASGTHSIKEILPAAPEKPVDVYIYSNVDDLTSALKLGGQEWSAGRANPDLGVVLVAIEPGADQSIEMGTNIPNELAHLLMYRVLADGYARQPTWLLEGFASMMERSPNPEYTKALQTASQNDSLLSLGDLCASFPADARNAFLAYAQAQSFVTYLRNTYGNSGITRLMDSYSAGLSCELGATNALGISMSQVEKHWRESVFGQNVLGAAAGGLAPFMFLMALVLSISLWGAINMIWQRRKRGEQSK
jgi:hypothetical protein